MNHPKVTITLRQLCAYLICAVLWGGIVFALAWAAATGG